MVIGQNTDSIFSLREKEPELWGRLPEDLQKKLLAATSEKARRSVLNSHIKILEDHIWPLKKNIESLRSKRMALQQKADAWEEIQKIATAPKLQKLGESCFHKLIEAVNAGDVILPVDDREALKDDFKWTPAPTMKVFVVQHNWAAAFENAKDFGESGEIRMPYDDSVFEFRISGHRVCCCIGAEDGLARGFISYLQTSAGWAFIGYNTFESGDWKRHTENTEICAEIFNLIRLQIRAICVALDAEVAETEIVRAAYKLNRKRERAGKLPIYDHHLVHLASRKRYAPLLVEEDKTERTQKRLHFVRGHWRHFEVHKTWIKWHLRGNPDLGFIDKEYRL